MTIKCPKCEARKPFDAFGIQVIEEDALLTCPGCGAQFQITATLEQLPGDEEEPLKDLGAGDEEGPLSEPELEAPPEEGPPAGGEEEESAKSPARVLLCTECKKDWIGAFTETCPFCASRKVMASTKTLKQKAMEVVEDVERGILPVGHALSLLLGRV